MAHRMKALVIGLGSMGRRRIRLLKNYDKTIVIVGIDTSNERRQQAENEYGIRSYVDMESALIDESNINIAFVSTSPLSHLEIIRECLNQGWHTFSEINLVCEGYDEIETQAREKGLVLFLSSTFLYRKEVEYINRVLNGSSTLKSYIYHIGQYLPDWHPWENYRHYFVSEKRTNACREIMAIEFPWLFDAFGLPLEWHVQKEKKSCLEIDYPDTYQIMFTHSKGITGIVQIDVVSRKAVRDFSCVAEDLYISWDGTPDGLNVYDIERKRDNTIKLYDIVDKRKEYSASIIEDAYLSEIKEFMDVIKGCAEARYSFSKDKQILSIIDDIEGIKA